MLGPVPGLVDHQDARVVVGELGDLLAAAATRRAGLYVFVAAGNGNRADAAAARDGHGRDGAGFCAGTLGIGLVLDITADVKSAVFVDERAADPVIRILPVGVLAGRDGGR